jgi:hypothetical protein
MPRLDMLAAVACAACCIEAVLLQPARALPPPPNPAAAATPSPTAAAPSGAATLPIGSPIDLVLDDRVDSKKTQPGTAVRFHLAKALDVGGVQLAPAGATGTLKVVATRPAVAPDVDGAVQIDLDPLAIPGHGSLPLTATKSYITVEQTAGQQSTNSLEDAAKDILIPGHSLYRNLRKGRELSLPPGSILRARTGATISIGAGNTVVIATPPPFVLSTDMPYAAFTPIPLYTLPTPPPHAAQTPAPKATPTPLPSPATTAAPAGTASPSR